MVKWLVKLIIFFAPFTSFFAVNGWLRLPVIIIVTLGIVVFCVAFLKKEQFFKSLQFNPEDILLICFVVFSSISFSINQINFLENRSFNHLMAIYFVVFCYFLLFKFSVNYSAITSQEIIKTIAFSLIACISIVILDFVCINVFNYPLRLLYVNENAGASNMMYYYRLSNIRSVGGVAEEPAYMQMFLNLYFPIALIYFQKNKSATIALIIAFGLSSLFLFSTAGILFFTLSATFGLVYNSIILKKINIKLLIWVITGIVSIYIIGFTAYNYFERSADKLLDTFLQRLTLSNSNSSVSDRLLAWDYAYATISDNPFFGNGPGYDSELIETGFLSLYLTLASNIGLPGTSFLVLFLIVILFKTFNLPFNSRFFFILSITSALLHYMVVSHYYHAPLWILIVLIQKIYKEESKLSNKIL